MLKLHVAKSTTKKKSVFNAYQVTMYFISSMTISMIPAPSTIFCMHDDHCQTSIQPCNIILLTDYINDIYIIPEIVTVKEQETGFPDGSVVV